MRWDTTTQGGFPHGEPGDERAGHGTQSPHVVRTADASGARQVGNR